MPQRSAIISTAAGCSWRMVWRMVVFPPGEGNGTPLQYSCLENPMDGGAWWAAVHGVTKSRTRLSDFTFIFHFHALEKEMATHSSVLAWRIPEIGQPGGLPSMESHRVGHDWSDLAAAAVFPPHKIKKLWKGISLVRQRVKDRWIPTSFSWSLPCKGLIQANYPAYELSYLVAFFLVSLVAELFSFVKVKLTSWSTVSSTFGPLNQKQGSWRVWRERK